MSTTIIVALLTSATVLAAAAKYAGTKLAAYTQTAAGSKYAAYIGYGIQAVKIAEQVIPDETENKGAAKADYALKVFLKRYEEETGEAVKATVDVAQIRALIEEALEIVKANGTLAK